MSIIYTNKNNINGLKLFLSSLFGNKNVELKNVELTEVSSPMKRLPILELENGTQIFSINAACKYLFPASQKLNIVIDQLLEWESTILLPILLNSTNKSSNIILEQCLKYLDNYLDKSSYLLTDDITVADLVVFSSMYALYLDEELRKSYLNTKLQNWINLLLTQPYLIEGLKKYPLTSSAYKILLTSLPSHAILDAPKIDIPSNSGDSNNSSPLHQASLEVLSPEELQEAKNTWLDATDFKVKQPVYPVVPVPGERNILVTSALPYVNNVPHLGNIIGCVLSADVFARFSRLCNYNTLFVCGTDEYGTATETKALAEGLTPQQICDKYFQIHNDIYRWFGIGFDYFGRTTTPEQTEICQEFFLKLNSNGFISTQAVDQLYCSKCDRFLADRFVEGGCPNVGCTYEDARGDQCDGCGKLVNAIELKNPRCKQCSNGPKIMQSEQFFFDLPKIEPMLKLWMKSVWDGWSYNAKVIANSWMKEGLKPRCITRDLKWGIPVPLEKYKKKVFYVWFDAPIGYVSITKRYSSTAWKQWWCPDRKTNPNIEVELYQFMAKDNVPFHSVMFPATLLAINEGHTVVKHLMATEYLNYEDGKFSKSRGIGVFGNDARDTGISADVWRFYLLYVRPESQDSSFSWSDLATKNNSELLNNLGNFVNRALVFCEKNFNGIIPQITIVDDDVTLLALCNRELKSYINSLSKAHLRDGIRHILAISRHGNQYMQANQPWVLLKGTDEEKARAGTVVGLCCNLACLLSILLQPYMPETSRIMKQQLNASDDVILITPSLPRVRNLLPSGHKIGKPAPLFSKIDLARVEELKSKYGGVQNEEPSTETKSKNTLVNDFEIVIKKQEDKINSMKSKNAPQSDLQAEILKLNELKKQLKDIKKGNIPKNLKNGTNEGGLVNGEVKSAPVATPIDEGLIKEIEAKITQQGELVRSLKSSGAEKSVWEPEVKRLLELKTQLVAAGGTPTPAPAPGKSKKSKK